MRTAASGVNPRKFFFWPQSIRMWAIPMWAVHQDPWWVQVQEPSRMASSSTSRKAIAGALYAGGFMTKSDMLGTWGRLHWPIILAAHAAIAAGTYFGGWRIVKTMGQKITKLRPVGGTAPKPQAHSRYLEQLSRGFRSDYSYHYRSDRGSRRGVPPLGGTLRRRRAHHLGLDLHHPCIRPGRGGNVFHHE
jgi:hypothetical protein